MRKLNLVTTIVSIIGSESQELEKLPFRTTKSLFGYLWRKNRGQSSWLFTLKTLEGYTEDKIKSLGDENEI